MVNHLSQNLSLVFRRSEDEQHSKKARWQVPTQI